MAKPAQALTKAVRDYLGMNGWYVWKGGTGAVRLAGDRFACFGTKGASDLFALKNGKLIAIEIKAGKDSLRIEQREFLNAIQLHGGFACVCRSLDDIINLLFAINKGLE